jgi:hypothetical protein
VLHVSLRLRASAAGATIATILIVAATGCGRSPGTSLERLTESRRLAAELLVQFTTAADAANRAVMSDTDDGSIAAAREAEQATATVRRDAATLGPMLAQLGYADETRLLEEFGHRFEEYQALDRRILELAVENTNLKAQGLSFGPAQQAADAFRDALEAVRPTDKTAANGWHVEALIATAVARVREVQALQAPHIAESDEAAMSALEKRMAAAATAAQSALDAIGGLVRPPAPPQLAAAAKALGRFTELNAEIIALSRRNSNVRSLALSLGQKRTLTAACQESLRALQDGLASRGFSGTR